MLQADKLCGGAFVEINDGNPAVELEMPFETGIGHHLRLCADREPAACLLLIANDGSGEVIRCCRSNAASKVHGFGITLLQ